MEMYEKIKIYLQNKKRNWTESGVEGPRTPTPLWEGVPSSRAPLQQLLYRRKLGAPRPRFCQGKWYFGTRRPEGPVGQALHASTMSAHHARGSQPQTLARSAPARGAQPRRLPAFSVTRRQPTD